MKDFVIDGHIDTLLNFDDKRYNFFSINQNYHVDFPRLIQANIGLQVFAMFVEPKYMNNKALERTLELIDRFYNLYGKSDKLCLIKRYENIKNSISQNKLGIILSVEGGYCITNVSILRILYKLGIRLITLTWNNSNQLATGIKDEEAESGLTELGKNIVKEMNKLGMIIDVSHLSPASFWDVIKYSQKPVVASHSNAKEICNHPRNLSDKQIKALASNGGLMGINFFPDFLNNSGQAEINDIVKHINYIRQLVGVNHIALGTDFDGINSTPTGLEHIGKLSILKDKLKKEGYADKEINIIFKDNWLRIFREVLKK